MTLKIAADDSFLQEIIAGYTEDSWCKTLPSAALSLPTLQLHDNLWYIGDCLIIPHTGTLCETLFTLTHDTLGHFGFHKTYGSLHDSVATAPAQSQLKPEAEPSLAEAQPELPSDGSHISANSSSS